MAITYNFLSVDQKDNGNEISKFISITDAQYLPVSKGDNNKQQSIDFNGNLGFFYNTETNLLQFWDGSRWKTVTLL